MQTTDGGTTWQDRSGGLPPNPSNPSERFDVRCAYFVNPMVGWVAGTFFGLLKTTDGGESWQTQHLDWEAYEYYQVFTEICFIDSSRGWAIAGETGNRIVRTTDGGATWLGDFRRDHISDGNLTGLSFPDASHGFVGNRDVDYPPMATTDGGITWSALPSLPTGYFLWDMTFVDSLHGWAAGLVVESEPHRGLILETKDGGTSWTADAFAEPTGFLQLRFPSPNVGYVLGVNGSLLRYSRLSGVAQDRETPEVAFALCPNPAGGRVSVRGSESLAGKVRLLVTSALGERVASSVVGEMDRHAGEIGFSVEGWPPGVYLCTILGAGTPVTLPLIVR
jgi:photosystem II stability/assembly factor-like uncharacterized protein